MANTCVVNILGHRGEAGRRITEAWQRTRLRLLPTNVKSSACTLFESAIMRVLYSLVSSLLLSGAAIVSAASSWGFEDATISIASKGTGVGGGSKDK